MTTDELVTAICTEDIATQLELVETLVLGLKHISKGAYLNACEEKRAAGYRGAVCIARETLEVVKKKLEAK